jgi:hypothetical protein
MEAAQAAIGRIESEQHHGLFIDYTQAHRVTLAEVIEHTSRTSARFIRAGKLKLGRCVGSLRTVNTNCGRHFGSRITFAPLASRR